MLTLPPLEDGFPLLLESLECLVPVFRLDDPQVELVLLLLPCPRYRFESRTDTNRATLADLLSEPDSLTKSTLPRRLQNLLASIDLLISDPFPGFFRQDLDQPIGEAEEVGLGGGDAAAGEDEVLGAVEADESGEAVGAAGAGHDAQPGLGEAYKGVGGEDAEGGGQGELEAAAEGEGGDCADGGDGEGGEGLECVAEVVEELGCSVRQRV